MFIFVDRFCFMLLVRPPTRGCPRAARGSGAERRPRKQDHAPRRRSAFWAGRRGFGSTRPPLRSRSVCPFCLVSFGGAAERRGREEKQPPHDRKSAAVRALGGGGCPIPPLQRSLSTLAANVPAGTELRLPLALQGRRERFAPQPFCLFFGGNVLASRPWAGPANWPFRQPKRALPRNGPPARSCWPPETRRRFLHDG